MLRQKIFLFLITPAHIWTSVMAFLCGFIYIDNSSFDRFD